MQGFKLNSTSSNGYLNAIISTRILLGFFFFERATETSMNLCHFISFSIHRICCLSVNHYNLTVCLRLEQDDNGTRS